MFNKKVILISHHNEVPGLGHKIADYLDSHFSFSVFASHPLSPRSSVKSFITANDKKITYKIPLFFQYFLEGISVWFHFRKNWLNRFYFDLAICLDPLSYIHAHLYKKIGFVKKTVYFNVDYSAKRYNNPLLNFIYVSLNKFAYIQCDYFFHITNAGVNEIDPNKKYAYKSFLITHTIKLKKKLQIKKIPNSILYAGNISYGTAFSQLINALIELKKKNVNFIFDIYGDGDKKIQLEKMVEESVISKNVHFKGSVENDVLLEKIMPKYCISVAPYTLKEDFPQTAPSHVYAGENLSTKIVEYIGCGLPVISTRPYAAFDVIVKNRFGFLVKSDRDWYNAISTLITDKKRLKAYSKNAFSYARRFDEEKVFNPIFNKILKS